MPTQLPAGPARTRASDQDREQVVAFIRWHWSQGRLTDEELERRVGQALAARSLGDFRELCADLPPPPRSQGDRVRRRGTYLLRTMRTPGAAAAIIGATLLGLAVLGAVYAPDDPAREPVVTPAP